MTNQCMWVSAAGLALAMAAWAQAPEPGAVLIHKEVRTVSGPGPQDAFMYEAGPVTMDFIGAEMSFGDKPVKGAPYAAEALTETTQTLSDGNHITRKSTATIFRDSQGRTRREETLGAIGPWAGGGDPPRTIFITDPVAGVSYHLDPQAHIAHKITMSKDAFFFNEAGAAGAGEKMFTFHRELPLPPPPPAGAPGKGVSIAVAGAIAGTFDVAIPKGARPDVKSESLPKQTIEGVQAEGTRSTITIAAGAIGNERAIESTSERWYSSELQTVVMSKRSDPRFGDTVYRLTNVQRGEQPSTLFEVPSDYTVRDDMAIATEKMNRVRKPVE